ncbi:hypothetical protein Glove_117g335 [Diversispora epigaea]|uniref:Uncharacterized protein n=1 Tax=Diversispora epigaea TaxID=1348612 RepID=A0A397J4M9_9GLOM|nr:hypothetical protein Glove_117g335 [Diversispora epigaea]
MTCTDIEQYEDESNEITSQNSENEKNLPIYIQRKLLKAKFLTLSILDYNLTNAIQKYKIKANITNDASHLLKTLIQHKSNNPGWFVKFQFEENTG